MKFVVTGGAGFIGSHLVEALASRGEVAVIDNFSQGSMQNLAHIRGKKLQIFEADIRDETKVREAMQGADIVFHEAALRAVAPSVSHPQLYHENNVLGSRCILNCAAELGVKKIIFASSSSVYGDTVAFPTKESGPVQPRSPYAETKLQTEHELKEAHERYGLNYVILRYFSVFGPRQNPQSKYAMAIPLFIDRLLHGQPCVIHGSGEQSRDFTYVKNVVTANLLAMETEKANNHTINIGSGERITVNELARKIAGILGVSIEPVHDASLPGESLHTHADISLAKELLGYEPEVSVEDGLRMTVDYFKAQTKL